MSTYAPRKKKACLNASHLGMTLFDGVGEGQIKHVINNEVKGILECLNSLKGFNGEVAEILVNKRIDKKLFKPIENDATNPEPGTLVTKEICQTSKEFYLASQKVFQGTATPTKYILIHNDTEISLEQFYELTYSQCYNYFGKNGSVRVPALVQYAHKLAFLAGQTLKESPSEKLKGQLFFI